MSETPDYSRADTALDANGRAITAALIDVAYELRTANLIEFGWIVGPAPDGLVKQIASRLGLSDEA